MKTQRRKGKKRLSMDIPEGMHRRLVEIAQEKEITLTTLILRAIIGLIQK